MTRYWYLEMALGLGVRREWKNDEQPVGGKWKNLWFFFALSFDAGSDSKPTHKPVLSFFTFKLI